MGCSNTKIYILLTSPPRDFRENGSKTEAPASARETWMRVRNPRTSEAEGASQTHGKGRNTKRGRERREV